MVLWGEAGACFANLQNYREGARLRKRPSSGASKAERKLGRTATTDLPSLVNEMVQQELKAGAQEAWFGHRGGLQPAHLRALG